LGNICTICNRYFFNETSARRKSSHEEGKPCYRNWKGVPKDEFEKTVPFVSNEWRFDKGCFINVGGRLGNLPYQTHLVFFDGHFHLYDGHRRTLEFDAGDVADVQISEGSPKIIDAALFGVLGGLVGGRVYLNMKLKNDDYIMFNCGIRTEYSRTQALQTAGLIKEKIKPYQITDEQECPFCAEVIKAKAKRCRYCGADLTDKAPKEKSSDEATITHDIFVGEQLAFREGEPVQIETVSPDPNRPEYRYVVNSLSLNKRFRLSDNDLIRFEPTVD
jgi:hypothetical protein